MLRITTEIIFEEGFNHFPEDISLEDESARYSSLYNIECFTYIISPLIPG